MQESGVSMLLAELSADVIGMGEQAPRISPEVTELDRQLNRRVEIKIELPAQSSFEYCRQK